MDTYEKKYKEALEKAEETIKYYKERKRNEASIEDLQEIFPELKESEDERIKKSLIEFVKQSSEVLDKQNQNNMIDWLEKQGEQKSVDKVEPRFKNGQWIVWRDKCYKVNYNGCGYELIGQDGLSTSLEYGTIDENAHLFTIQDAKDGDVLVSRYNKPFIYNENRDSFHIGSYCGISVEDRFKVATEKCHWTENVNIQPATKEQRDTLFAKMKKAGYEWDAEKKELRKIVTPIFNIGDAIIKKNNSDINKFGQFTITDIKDGKYWYNDRIICDISEQYEWELVERKPISFDTSTPVSYDDIPFGEKDYELHEATYFIPEGFHAEIEGDKVIVKRGEQKPAWSEEDETGWTNTMIMIKEVASNHYTKDSIKLVIDWLKSLKDRIGG